MIVLWKKICSTHCKKSPQLVLTEKLPILLLAGWCLISKDFLVSLFQMPMTPSTGTGAYDITAQLWDEEEVGPVTTSSVLIQIISAVNPAMSNLGFMEIEFYTGLSKWSGPPFTCLRIPYMLRYHQFPQEGTNRNLVTWLNGEGKLYAYPMHWNQRCSE